MVTPVAATAAVQFYVAESDIAMFPTVGDIWLNRITRAALANAAEAVAGMAKARQKRRANDGGARELIGSRRSATCSRRSTASPRGSKRRASR